VSEIIIVMGVSGSGKTTLAQAIAKILDYNFLEGDEYHSKENKLKMKKGIPLTDEDRIPWLKEINQELHKKRGGKIVLACSALKEKYRKLLQDRFAPETILWIYLCNEYSIVKARMKNRNHFMPVTLLKSQLEELEPPKKALKMNSSLTINKMINKLKLHLNEN